MVNVVYPTPLPNAQLINVAGTRSRAGGCIIGHTEQSTADPTTTLIVEREARLNLDTCDYTIERASLPRNSPTAVQLTTGLALPGGYSQQTEGAGSGYDPSYYGANTYESTCATLVTGPSGYNCGANNGAGGFNLSIENQEGGKWNYNCLTYGGWGTGAAQTWLAGWSLTGENFQSSASCSYISSSQTSTSFYGSGAGSALCQGGHVFLSQSVWTSEPDPNSFQTYYGESWSGVGDGSPACVDTMFFWHLG